MATRSPRYTAVAITLHWLIAVSLVSLILVGWWMGEAINEPETRAAAYQAFQLHKAFGITVLVLTIARLVWRLMNPPPPLSADSPAWERFAANATHAAFYALSIGIPLAGLVYVSTGWLAGEGEDRAFSVATSYFGLFTVPHIPFIAALSEEARRTIAFMSVNAHSKMAWGVIVLLVLHAGAALKHHFVDKDNVLAGMVPVVPLRPETESPPATASPLAFVTGVAVVLALAIATALLGAPETPMPKTAAAIEAPAAPAPAAAPAPDAEQSAAPDATEAAAPANTATASTAWTVDPQASRITFKGEHAGNSFTGRFERWRADIRFDPADLKAARAKVTIETGSAKTGDGTQESSLQEGEWFGPATFPTATFEATSFKALGGDTYEARGTLTIKDRRIPVVLPFELKIDGDRARMRGAVTLDRLALDLGVKSDPTADWVSRTIDVEVRVEATRAAS